MRKSIRKALELHEKWLAGEEDGKRFRWLDFFKKNQIVREYMNFSHADLRKADLSYAYLAGANLEFANLKGANLRKADLFSADLSHSHLIGAFLYNTSFRNANLSGANLARVLGGKTIFCCADLSYSFMYRAGLNYCDMCLANFQSADLTEADFSDADLTKAKFKNSILKNTKLIGACFAGAIFDGTDFADAELNYADFRGAHFIRPENINEAQFDEDTTGLALACPEEGSYIGYKIAGTKLIKLKILSDALRCSGTSRSCRASKAKVLEIAELLDPVENNEDSVASNFDKNFIYKVGEVIEVKDFNTNRWAEENATGIYHFITKVEAINWFYEERRR